MWNTSGAIWLLQQRLYTKQKPVPNIQFYSLGVWPQEGNTADLALIFSLIQWIRLQWQLGFLLHATGTNW